MAGKKLTPKQEAFVREYPADLNGAAAYRRAGYAAKNDHAAAVGAARLLTNVDIAAAIGAARAGAAAACGVTARAVLDELAVVGFSSVWHYRVDDGGNVTLADGAPAGAIRAVSSIKHKVRAVPGTDPAGKPLVEHEVEIRLWPKVEALGKLGKHLGLFPDKVEVTGKGGAPLIAVVEVARPDA